MIKQLIALAIIAFSLNSPFTYANKIEVKVGGYLFPPFVQIDSHDSSGLTHDLIDLFNQQQSEFFFIFVPTSPKRRYSDFKRGLFDAVFFENINWSWDKDKLDASQVFLSGGEAFFTHNIEGRDDDYFNVLNGKSIVAILGYHYHFLNNVTDTKTLKEQYNIKFVNSPDTALNQVVNSKSDIGIATYSYLQQQIKLNPQLKQTLLISQKFDQTYEHTILIRKKHPLSINKINTLLNKIQNNGSLNHILEKYGISPLAQTP
ncbi:MAG: polar amino acid transport system substrate-binding protein [Oceanicoccus sp.]|jgi:polar amino acid transport system substrate-binding protein